MLLNECAAYLKIRKIWRITKNAIAYRTHIHCVVFRKFTVHHATLIII